LARNHPRALLGLVLLTALGGAAGLYVYARQQWQEAQSALKENRLEEADHRLQFCLSTWPHWLPPPWNLADVHRTAARCCRLSGKITAAEAHLNKCIKLEKHASEATQLEFLLLRVQSGEEEEAIDALMTLVEARHAESQLILETIARSYMHRFRFGPAYACLNFWIDIAPDQAKPYRWRGWVMERMNNNKRAMADYLRALALEPQLTDVSLHVGEMLLDDNKPIEALAYLEPLHAQFPDRADVTARLGQCCYLQGRIPEARRLLEAAMQHCPDDAPLLLCLAKIDIAQARPAAAEVRLRRALEIDPSDMDAQFNLATALRDQNRRTEAAQELKKLDEQKALLTRAYELLHAEAQHPTSDPKAASEIGKLLLRFGHERQALYWLDQALLRDPDHLPAHQAFAEYFESKGDTKSAAAHRRKLTAAGQGG
jgi:tetratricopeptide (TPR) repeat protein